MDQLQSARWFTKLDLKSGYHQVRIKEEDTWKTTFKTKQGIFEWLLMLFVLCNAPATFMRLINEVLRSYIDDFVIVYLDDILVFSPTWEEHLIHVEKVLETLRQYQLRLNMKKCEFGKSYLVYLGFIVGDEELKVDPFKVQAITDWPRPCIVTEVRNFMGACQYLRTDVSNYAMGDILKQDGKLVEYSEMFNAAVRNYPTYKKELFALHQCVKHWRCYLLDTLSRPPGHSALLVAMQLQLVVLSEYITSYDSDPEFKMFFDKLQRGKPCQFEMKDGFMFKGTLICIPNNGDRLQWIREAHTSRCAGHFGVDKTLLNLQRYVYWPWMHVDVSRFIRGCVLCNTSKPSRKLGLFSKMVILIPCKKTISGEGAAKLFFHHVWKHFGLPTSIISDRDSRFLGHFWKSLWGLMDTKLKHSTNFHPQTEGQTEVVNRTLVHLLRGYNSKHPRTWDVSLPYLQFAFNRAIHSSILKSHFEVCLSYLPSSPFDMVFSVGDKQNGEENDDRLKAQRLLESISKIHKEVEEQLQKERLHGVGRKLNPIQYGPFKILEKIGENAFRLELPPYMQMYSIINAEYLKPFEPSLLDDDEDIKDSRLPLLDDLWFEMEDPLMADCILETAVLAFAGASASLKWRAMIQVDLSQMRELMHLFQDGAIFGGGGRIGVSWDCLSVANLTAWCSGPRGCVSTRDVLLLDAVRLCAGVPARSTVRQDDDEVRVEDVLNAAPVLR
ncbi:unnamed protein product [Prunus armeniaca]